MFSGARDHFIARVEAAPIRFEPFEHLYVENVLPDDLYREIQLNLVTNSTYLPLQSTDRVSKNYNRARFIIRPRDLDELPLDPATKDFWRNLFAELSGATITNLWTRRFNRAIQAQLATIAAGGRWTSSVAVAGDAALVRDLSSFRLGPHTDSPTKLVSVLLYLAADDSAPDLGTSFYRPRQVGYECPGEMHHLRSDFELVTTLPYLPNTLLAFPKSSVCFHGVEPVPEARSRDVFQYNIRLLDPNA